MIDWPTPKHDNGASPSDSSEHVARREGYIDGWNECLEECKRVVPPKGVHWNRTVREMMAKWTPEQVARYTDEKKRLAAPAYEPVAEVVDEICADHQGVVDGLTWLPSGTKLYSRPAMLQVDEEAMIRIFDEYLEATREPVERSNGRKIYPYMEEEWDAFRWAIKAAIALQQQCDTRLPPDVPSKD